MAMLMAIQVCRRYSTRQALKLLQLCTSLQNDLVMEFRDVCRRHARLPKRFFVHHHVGTFATQCFAIRQRDSLGQV